MIQTKNRYAQIIVDAFEVQEKYAADRKATDSINTIKNFQEDMIAKSLDLPEETRTFIAEKMYNDLSDHIQGIEATRGALMTKEEYNQKIEQFNIDYMEMSKDTKMQDVAFEIESTYSGGTKSFKEAVAHLNGRGANIDYVYDSKIGNIGKLDAHMVVIMPASSYEEFINEVHADRPDSSMDIIGARKECFYINHINKEVSLDDIKKEVKASISEDGNGLGAFNKTCSLGYTSLSHSNFYPLNNIRNGIHTVLSQVRALEHNRKEDGINIRATNYIMTSSLGYNSNAGDESLVGLQVTPLKEAKRALEKSAELVNEQSNTLDNVKDTQTNRRRNKPK